MYVKLLEGLINKPCKQSLKEQNSTFLSPSNTQFPSSQVQSTVQWQEHHHIEAVATSRRDDYCNSGPLGNASKEDPTNEKVNWSSNAITALMAEYKDHAKTFRTNTKGHTKIWKKISSNLHMNGYLYTHKQCENKFKNLKNRYHAKIDNMKSKQTGTPPLRFDYFDIFHEIFGQKPNVEPVALASATRGSASLDILKAVNDNVIFQDDSDENEASINDVKKRKRVEATPTQNKEKKTKFENAVDEMKKAIEHKSTQQDLRQERLLAVYKEQTDRLINSMDNLIKKL
ncbi:uncharacterized protein LOC105833352 [Monomorium pharaonis]|uniref:uncharacterized protein LOC105833352 n=1 Tax=Monomorium pharaonis TaxID=307658 RepID=UPI00063F158A|nr:uncharacterized protein LOC105833352 [Monomorium pharaonis]